MQNYFIEAIDLYDLVINFTKNYYLGYFLKGFSYRIFKGYALLVAEYYEQAIVEIDTSIKLNQYNEDAYFYKGNIRIFIIGHALQQLQRYDDAL